MADHALTIESQLIEAATTGDLQTLTSLLDAHPDQLHVRDAPYGFSLLHLAARNGHLAAADSLLGRGLDVNIRERGDNTYPMHWAAAAGHVDVVQRLADAGGDVVGHGDDHALEVIGWATCWDGCDDAAHRAIVEILLSRGAKHHIFSAMSIGLADEVRRIVAENPAALEQRMSHNEDHQRPLHFAVRRNLSEMVALLLELGADPAGKDASGHRPTAYATTAAHDRRLVEALLARGESLDLFAALTLGDSDKALRLLHAHPSAVASGSGTGGVLHLMAKRGNTAAVKWLLDHGANPDALWAHWDADVTPLHLAILSNHPEIVRVLLAAGADPSIKDSKHDSDAPGWAEFFGRLEIVEMLKDQRLT